MLVGLVVGVWVLWIFASEMLIAHRLHLQAAGLRVENARIAQQNDDLRRTVTGSESASAREEEARRHEFARPEEHVYIVTPPSPAPSARRPAPSAAPAGQGWQERIRGWWTDWRKPWE